MTSLGVPGSKDLGTRFTVVGFLPVLAGVLSVVLLVSSGPPSRAPSLGHAVGALNAVSGGEWAGLGIALVVLVALLNPLQLQLVRALEGYRLGGPALGWLYRLRTRRHVAIRRELERRVGDAGLAEDTRRRAGVALRRNYPPDEDRTLPTLLGNVLRAGEDRAGQYYGFDTVTVWPRLYLVLPDRAAGLVEDARNQLDAACRYCVVFTLATVSYAVLLAVHRWWLLLAIAPAPAAVAARSYASAVGVARVYGLLLQASFDAYRFDLLRALRIALPVTAQDERAANQALTRWFAQGVDHNLPYRDGS